MRGPRVLSGPRNGSGLIRDAYRRYGASQAKLRFPAQAWRTVERDGYAIHLADAFEWLHQAKANSVHAVVTDPPYGLVEYRPDQLAKLRTGRGGVWRIPPSFDGCERRPLPRFTVLTAGDRRTLAEFFRRFATAVLRVLVPGGHVFIASNPLLHHIVAAAMEGGGMEPRGTIVRLVQTLRGGDRPKNAHEEFSEVSVMPRSQWEPWVLCRKPCEGRVQDNLRKWKAGGLRRLAKAVPFGDVIASSPTRAEERTMADHPSLKPQRFLRQIVRAALPLGTGIVVDPFMGSGSTIAAAVALGYRAVGIELNPTYFDLAESAIPRLAALKLNGEANGPPR